jgi:hypothetical protein
VDTPLRVDGDLISPRFTTASKIALYNNNPIVEQRFLEMQAVQIS